jgi:hypothetical protein
MKVQWQVRHGLSKILQVASLPDYFEMASLRFVGPAASEASETIDDACTRSRSRCQSHLRDFLQPFSASQCAVIRIAGYDQLGLLAHEVHPFYSSKNVVSPKSGTEAGLARALSPERDPSVAAERIPLRPPCPVEGKVNAEAVQLGQIPQFRRRHLGDRRVPADWYRHDHSHRRQYL